METSKQKAIIEAYGEYWEQVKDFVDENGWCRNRKIAGFYNSLREIQNHPNVNYWFRPLSLQGIENNNGWIKVESEEDLPSNGTKCHFIINRFEENDYQGHFYDGLFWNSYSEAYTHNIVTHYQPIQKPNPPLH